MDANQLIRAVEEAASNTKPPHEYCFLWIDHWATCMTKGEWSGWMQFVGSILALIIAISIPLIQNRNSRKKNLAMANQCLLHMCGAMTAVLVMSQRQKAKDTLYVARETFNTVFRSFESVNSLDLPKSALPTWFAAIASAEQIKNIAERCQDIAGSDDGFKKMLEKYSETWQDYAAQFEKIKS
ncbi:hypothetical protein WH367_07110 [Comamonas sp. MYb21]|uniref:hypothetical protein n=1 Tax=Comamonas sp. MYb21 TaxID=1848648 RepID=UPI0030B00680